MRIFILTSGLVLVAIASVSAVGAGLTLMQTDRIGNQAAGVLVIGSVVLLWITWGVNVALNALEARPGQKVRWW